MLGGLKDSTGLHLQWMSQTSMWTLRCETSVSLLLLVSMHNLLFYLSPEDWELVSGSHQQDRPYVKIRLPCQAMLLQSSGRVPSRQSGKGNDCKHCTHRQELMIISQLSTVTLILNNFPISMTLVSFKIKNCDQLWSIAVDHMSNSNQNIRFDYLN